MLRDADEPEAHYLPEITALGTAIPDAEAIAIDIPIGLPAEGRRLADIEAKLILGDRRSSVFYTPVRAALEAPDHATATRISTELTGFGISQQSYSLRTKIFEVERWLPVAPCGVWEAHPEVSFRFLLGQPASEAKKTWAGIIERQIVLYEAEIVLDRTSSAVGAKAAADDMLDAGAMAWTAKRLIDGIARSIPEHPEFDTDGRAIAIWA